MEKTHIEHEQKNQETRKLNIYDFIALILSSSLFLQRITSFIMIRLFKADIVSKELSMQLVLIVPILSLLLTIIVIKKRKLIFFNRKSVSKNEKKIIPGVTSNDWKVFLKSIPLYFILLISIAIVKFLVNSDISQNQEAIEIGINLIPKWLFFILMVIVAPITEEILFRGSILFSDGKLETTWLKVLLSGMIFGIIHFIGDINISNIISYVGIGVFLAYLAKKTRSLEIPILFHMLHNFMGFLVMF